MKSWLKAPAKWLWRRTAFLRRPISRKLDSFLSRVVSRELTGPMGHIVASLHRTEHEIRQIRRSTDLVHGETNLLLDTLLREVGRLQNEVDALRHSLAPPTGGDRHRAANDAGPRALAS